MNGLKWQVELKRIIKKVPYDIAEKWDPDAYNRRIPGQFGEYMPDFGNPNENLCVCIDISEPINFYEDYAEIIEYLGSLRGIRDKFKKIHFNFWAGGYYLSDPIRIKSTIGLLIKTEGYYKKAKESINTSIALASNIVKPLTHGNSWYRLKPALILILTKVNICNDLKQQHELEIKKHLNKIVWIFVSEITDINMTVIPRIDTNAKGRIILIKG